MNLPAMLDMQRLTTAPISADQAFRALVLKAIYTAAVVPTTVTAAISTSGPTTPQVENFIKELQQAGLKVTNGATTMTVAWA